MNNTRFVLYLNLMKEPFYLYLHPCLNDNELYPDCVLDWKQEPEEGLPLTDLGVVAAVDHLDR